MIATAAMWTALGRIAQNAPEGYTLNTNALVFILTVAVDVVAWVALGYTAGVIWG